MAADVDALNYPYIRVRHVEWLKRTLLIFPHVVRMTPDSHAPADDPAVSEFVWTSGSRGPLLRSARLWDQHVQNAQYTLIEELKALRDRRGADFMDNFNRLRSNNRTSKGLTVWERRLSPHPSFQIHRYKMYDALVEYLMEKKLAWIPDTDYSDGPGYLEMHPKLGEAVMATLATACAENEGLSVVTEFPKLHGQLIGTPRDAILRACLESPQPTAKTSGGQIAEFLVYRRCNVDALTAERIAALQEEREALMHFRTELETLATTLPETIHSEPMLQKRLDALADDIFSKWRHDQANLSSYGRNFFGKDPLKAPEKLVEELLKSVTKPEGATAVAAGTDVGFHFGHLTLNAAAGAAAGFVIAVIFRAARVWQETREHARTSPYRYLTTLEKQGVVFRMAGSGAPSAHDASANHVP